ncbi:FMN-binding protein [Prosthecobacter sp.]|uniref:FMN-binding protein n=1 Tax=Prosthecobacter sp. TaxID=1965333 RepID=UPI002ABC7BAF|nr:FMN-binding protein [Prosthecobacter sp.]MDZ4401856.1 FMN-binding protein [Prosthecobacter sp.]
MTSLLRIGIAVLLLAHCVNADTIELMNGNKVEGKVIANDATAKTVTVEAMIGGQLIQRMLPQAQVHALTVNGQRTVLTPKPGTPASSAAPVANASRSPDEVKALIAKEGSNPPGWMKSTKLNYPKTLDLTWANAPKGQWNNQKNIGQFNWDIINPNENRWQEGIKFMEHVLSVNKDNAEIRLRATKEIGGMYFRFFQDYARAAWWWQQAGVTADDPQSVFLAECYWRLGSKQMALDFIEGESFYLNTIKLMGDMGETDRAVELTEAFAEDADDPHGAYLLGGDACRLAGRYDEAIAYYQEVLDAPVDPKNKNRFQRLISRAQASLEAIKLFELLDITKVADGTYTSNALGYEGDVQVAVKVKSKRIEFVKVTQHKEKQYYSSMRDVPEQIIAKQGVKGVDATSRATITGVAIINATAKALAQGVK